MIRIWLVLLGLAVGLAPARAATPRPPNIILILADDLGWTDTAFAGSRFYTTPALDALAAGGQRFSSFYMSHDCAASRASILTGLYSPRTGIYSEDASLDRGDTQGRKLLPPANRTPLPPGVPTIASILKSAGYATGFFGRWLAGTNALERPEAFGFDESILVSAKHFGFATEPSAEIPTGTYLADYLSDKASDFVRRQSDKPFFALVSHLAVHPPYEAKQELVARFAKQPPAGGHRDATYAAMIAGLDSSVGTLLARLEEWRLAENTVVIFTSDSGAVGGYLESDNSSRRSGPSDNAPLRSGKGSFYEGGLRVPFVVRWPGVTQPGSRSTQPCIHVDLLPTLCAIGRATIPTNHPVDGEVLVPLFRDPSAPLGRDAIFWHFPGYHEVEGRPGLRTSPMGAIRAGNFKLLEFFEDGRLELFNLIEDLGEKNNLVRSLPDKAQELRTKLAGWRKALNAPMPAPRSPAVPSANASPAVPPPPSPPPPNPPAPVTSPAPSNAPPPTPRP